MADAKPVSFHATQPSFAGDLWGGLAAMLVALPSSVAFGILIFSAIGPEYAAQGAMYGLLGAAVQGLISPVFGRTIGLITSPCAPAAAVLSALIVALLQGTMGPSVNAMAIPALIGLTALFAGLMQVLFGAVGGGRLIKFIPYQVVSGYLSGVALIIAVGQVPKLLGVPKATGFFASLVSPNLWQLPGLVVGLTTIVGMVLAPKFIKKIPAAIVGLLFGVACYFVLSIFDSSLLQLNNNALIIGPIQANGSIFESIRTTFVSFQSIDIESVKMILIPALTLAVLLSIDTLKTCVSLDALTRTRHNSDRELIGQGLGNIASFFVGGMPGSGGTGPTMVNLASGGRTPRAGIIEGIFVIVALLSLRGLIAWIPIGALAGILLVIAWRMFDRQMFRLYKHRSGRLDLAVILGVVFVAVAFDLIKASGVGIALAILLFIRDQIQGSVIRRKSYIGQVTSKTQRLEAEHAILAKHSHEGVVVELQGNLFFGTTDQLFSSLEKDLKSARYVLFDMRRVQSIDYTAVHLLEQMNQQLSEQGGQLLFSGMPSGVVQQRDFERYLKNRGVIGGKSGVRISATMDSALEWIENQILQANGVTHDNSQPTLELKDFSLFREFTAQEIAALSSCVRAVSCKIDERVCTHGEKADEMFLVRRGSVRVMLPLQGGQYHHLATVGQGGFFGEIAFLDKEERTADIEAKEVSEFYVISRKQFDERSRADAAIGVQVFARLAKAMALRLRAADAQLRINEDR